MARLIVNCDGVDLRQLISSTESKMPSPFPGMNPWLEQDALWHDFHQRLLTAMSDCISDAVSPRYFVALEEHVYIHEPPEPRARQSIKC